MKKILTTIITMGISISLFAQQGIVRSGNGVPVENALIQNLNSNEITTSNALGKFRLFEGQNGDSVRAFLLGYQSQILILENEKSVEFELKEASISLESIKITPKKDNLNSLTDINLAINPVNNSQELLRYVPGLFIGQHAGGGKAEQIFLRGFDIDHGTDLSINVDNMPVNMVSHSHGQGYSDLHFIIPETIERIDFEKGSYQANQGNFSTAGSVDFKTKDRLEESTFGLEYGQFNQRRALGMFNLSPKRNNAINAYLASEYLYSDGPFESPQNLNRFNVLVKLTANLGQNQKLTFTGSHFTSKWDASGQIPQRAVDAGLITRFGAIDDTEGGNTSRTNLQGAYYKQLNNDDFFEVNAYFTQYDFLLFSNFTFFLENPTLGDQIRQSEDRNLFGINTKYVKPIDSRGTLSFGAGTRNDYVRNNELASTFQKNEVLNRIYFGNVNEQNLYFNSALNYNWEKWTIDVGARLDHFTFSYQDQKLENSVFETETQAILSPKLSATYQLNKNRELFFKSGLGYHSNDSRGVIAARTVQTLPRSYGADIGSVFKIGDKVLLNTTAWYLFLEQEFVYVGDAGIVEPSGRTRRLGVDVSMRAEVAKNTFYNTDFTYTYARSMDDPKGANLIPLAPIFTWTQGLNYSWENLSFGLQSRFLGERPAVEDTSIVAEGYFITDASAAYTFGKFTLGLRIENLFNTAWNETQFATLSRLSTEVNPVEEIHFTPGTPFSARFSLKLMF